MKHWLPGLAAHESDFVAEQDDAEDNFNRQPCRGVSVPHRTIAALPPGFDGPIAPGEHCFGHPRLITDIEGSGSKDPLVSIVTLPRQSFLSREIPRQFK